MLIVLLIFLLILLGFQSVILILIKNLSMDIVTLQSDMNLIRRTFVAPNTGGRPIPNAADIAAARVRAETAGKFAPNQVDSSGIAQVGGPPKT
jgi:hypothetical protein